MNLIITALLFNFISFCLAGNVTLQFLWDIIEMERNDLWLNVKGNYILITGEIILNLE